MRVNARTAKPWTDEEIALLRKHYPSCGHATREYLPSRTANAIRKRASEIGIPRPERKLRDGTNTVVDCNHHDEHMRKQDRQFCKAMLAHPEERPSSYDIPAETRGVKNPLNYFAAPPAANSGETAFRRRGPSLSCRVSPHPHSGENGERDVS